MLNMKNLERPPFFPSTERKTLILRYFLIKFIAVLNLVIQNFWLLDLTSVSKPKFIHEKGAEELKAPKTISQDIARKNQLFSLRIMIFIVVIKHSYRSEKKETNNSLI